MAPTPFAEFEHHNVAVKSRAVGDLKIHTRKYGKGEPLLLIHGYPQNSHLWNRVAPRLSEKYTVIIPDLRGYGKSSKPPGSESHVEYSKVEMAEDMVQVMKHFDFDSFFIVSHDRGSRVAHRLALDNPEKVRKLMVLDITPTVHMYEHTDMMFASGYWHWFFLIQQTPFPENVILGDPAAFWKLHCQRRAPNLWSEDDLKEYQNSWFTPEAVHASCEDYRAAATIDLDHDRESRSNGQKLAISDLRVLWGKQGIIEKMSNNGDAVEVWKSYSSDTTTVSGRAVDCGHYIPEEAPEELLAEIEEFLA